MSNEIVKPSIRIDLRKSRIVISRKAVNALGEPQYILLLVNPEERTLALLESDETERRAHRIRKNKDSEIELYSKSLLEALFAISGKWQENSSYRLYGEFIPSEKIVKFRIDSALLASGAEK
jgi:hypothetical protein